MAVEKIYIARHGFRLNWINSTWKSATGLPRDPPLAAYGLVQAQELADYFSSLPEDQRPTAIFSSPYYRCLQTSQPVAKALDIPIHIEHGTLPSYPWRPSDNADPLLGIAEWYSPVVPNTNLLHPRPGPTPTLQAHFPEVDTALWPSSLWYPSRKGETIEEVHVRVNGFLHLFSSAVEKKKYDIDCRRLLMVTHAATAIVLVRNLVGERELPLRAGCCSLSELDLKEETEALAKERGLLGAYRAVKLTDGSHMSGGVSREWGFEDVEVERGRVVEDPGEPGTEHEDDFPLGPQVHLLSNL